jgi:hypothetical protein
VAASAAKAPAPSASAPAPPANGSDPFSDFRASVIGASAESVFRFMPIEGFARTSRASAATQPPQFTDEALGLMQGLKVPLHVAGFEYPRQCRIRRVRVLASADDQLIEAPGPVIVSRRALGELRETR